ncbi:MAG: hypothetical protein P1P88_00990 [Bacteroidales bacterium]|nr:hypothetical protein [Bacteroidales bacterium]
MRNFKNVIMIMVAAMLLITSACKKDKNDPANNVVCLLTKIIDVYEDVDNDTTLIEYNDERLPVKITYHPAMGTFHGYVEYATIEYKDGKISSTTDFAGGVGFYRANYTWENSTLTVTRETLNDAGDWVTKDKVIYELDTDGLPTKSSSFSYINNEWVEFPIYSNYNWTNENLTLSENWARDPQVKRYDRSLNKMHQGRFATGLLKNINDDKLGSTTYTYDDKNNQLKIFSFYWGISNMSKNNVTKAVFTSTSSSSTSDYIYEYNEKGAPAKITRNYSYTDFGGSSSETYITLLEYNCN